MELARSMSRCTTRRPARDHPGAGARNILHNRDAVRFCSHPYESFSTSVERFLREGDGPKCAQLKEVYRSSRTPRMAICGRGRTEAGRVVVGSRPVREKPIFTSRRLEQLESLYTASSDSRSLKVIQVVRQIIQTGLALRSYGTGIIIPVPPPLRHFVCSADDMIARPHGAVQFPDHRYRRRK